jgi:para-nitrobenzyl esterase
MHHAKRPTTSGSWIGVKDGRVIRFRGVRFALPPTGAARYEPPCPAPLHAGDATRDGPIAPQGPSRLTSVLGDFDRPQDEDCLTLTVTTPLEDTSTLRSVVVFLHGGAYQACAGSLDWFDGARLVERGDLVFVSPNYRLGALGFLAHPDAKSPGSQGLLDIVEALRWVHAHISKFGGDPDNITVIGQSAGAHAILCMLAGSEPPPFKRAILQSPPTGVPPMSRAAASMLFADFDVILRSVGGTLNSAPTHLLRASGVLAKRGARLGDIRPPFLPVVDTLSAPEKFIALAAHGAARAGIPVLIGTTRDEAHAFLMPAGAPPPEVEVEAAIQRSGLTEAQIQAVAQRHRPMSRLALLSAIVTERVFRRPSLALTTAIADAGGTAWIYEFNWRPAASPLGACHCIELPFVFGNFPAWRDAPMLRGATAEEFERLASAVQARWINFIQGGEMEAGPIPGDAAIDPAVIIDVNPNSENRGSQW